MEASLAFARERRLRDADGVDAEAVCGMEEGKGVWEKRLVRLYRPWGRHIRSIT